MCHAGRALEVVEERRFFSDLPEPSVWWVWVRCDSQMAKRETASRMTIFYIWLALPQEERKIPDAIDRYARENDRRMIPNVV